MSAFDVSYRSLEPEHQRFFRLIGMSPCASISVPAAAALGGVTLAEAQQALAALLDHHLLGRATGGQFRFHDLIREYAALRATREDSGAERRRAVSRLLDYYLGTADQADRLLHPFRRRMPVPVNRRLPVSPALATTDGAAGWLETECRNILQAAQYAGRHEWKQKCADLIHVLGGFLEVRAYWDEAIAAHTLAVQAGRDLVDPARVARASLELSDGEPADRPARGSAPAGRGGRGDLPVAGRPARRGRGSGPDGPGPSARRALTGVAGLLHRSARRCTATPRTRTAWPRR